VPVLLCILHQQSVQVCGSANMSPPMPVLLFIQLQHKLQVRGYLCCCALRIECDNLSLTS